MHEQRSHEWYELRLGKVTASRVWHAVGKTKGGKYYAARENYMTELLAERLSGIRQPGPQTAAIRRGVELEHDARAAYKFYSGNDVVEVGFIDHPSIKMAGGSPDGLVGDDGIIEMKVPNLTTHINTLETGDIPDEYMAQMMWNIATTDRAWADYVSFDDRLPEHLRLFVKRVDRDNDRIAELEDEVRKFLAELDEKIERLEKAA